MRARVEKIELVETYRYLFEESRASSKRLTDAPSGRIRAIYPYARGAWLTPLAVGDLRRQSSREAPGASGEEQCATVGHLAFSRWHRTDLDRVLDLERNAGSVPLKVPFQRELSEPDRGCDDMDRRAAVVEWSYVPKAPEVVPVEVTARLMDWESLAAEQIVDLASDRTVDREALAEALRRPRADARGILIVVDLHLAVEPETHGGGIEPMISRAALSWPTIPWSESVSLVLGGVDKLENLPPEYLPESREAEWTRRLPMHRPQGRGGARRGRAQDWERRLIFQVDDVSELAAENDVWGRVEIVVPTVLVSGLRVRHFDATGALTDRRPRPWTRIVAELRLNVRELLRRRNRSILHRLSFDGVVLDERRVADVRSTLADCGLKVDTEYRSDGGGTAFVAAGRSVGGETLRVTVYLEGRRQTALRTTELAGGRSYRTKVQSGDLGLFLHGCLRGSDRMLTDVVDAVHGRLRKVFAVTRDHR